MLGFTNRIKKLFDFPDHYTCQESRPDAKGDIKMQDVTPSTAMQRIFCGSSKLVRDSFSHRVAKNAAALIVLQIANYVVPLLVLVYLTRVLGMERYGVVAFSIGLVQFSSILLDFGFTLSATQKISIWRLRKKYISRLIGSIFLIKFFIFLFVATGIILYSFLSVKYESHAYLFILSLIPIFGLGFQLDWFFTGIERMRHITIFSIIAKLIFLFLVMSLISDESDYLWVPVANGLAQVSALLISFYFMYRLGYHIALPRQRDIFYTVKVTSGFFMSRLSVTAYMNSGVVLLGLFSTPLAVATYSLAEQLYKALQSVFAPIVQAVYPYMAIEKNISLFFKIAMGCVAIAFTGAVFGYFLAPRVIPFFLGAEWGSSIPILNIFFVALTVHVMAVMSGYPLAVAIDRVDVANLSVVYGSLIYILCTSILISLGRATPSTFAILMIVSEFFVLVYRGIMLWPAAYRIERSKA